MGRQPAAASANRLGRFGHAKGLDDQVPIDFTGEGGLNAGIPGPQFQARGPQACSGDLQASSRGMLHDAKVLVGILELVLDHRGYPGLILHHVVAVQHAHPVLPARWQLQHTT